MTIRFAAAKSPVANTVVRRFCQLRLAPVPHGRAANDNAADVPADPLMFEALRHFAVHGLAAARDAKLKAQAAHRAGDDAAYERWLGICRHLDKRMARECATLAAGHRAEG